VTPVGPDGRFNLKLPWIRGEQGHLTVRVDRLDGPGDALVSIHESSYPPTGTLPTGVAVSAPGCWRIVGTLNDRKVTVMLRVKDADDLLPDGTAANEMSSFGRYHGRRGYVPGSYVR
jgi:hypothetical protein